MEYEYYNGGSLAGFSAAGRTIIDGLKYEAGGSAKFLTLHWTDDETVNWVQTLNARKWPEKIMVGPGVEECNAASAQLFGLLYPDDEYEHNGNIQRVERYRRTTPDDLWPVHATFQYQYDNLNRLKEFRFINLDDNVENRYDYEMDEFGNLENRTGTNNNGMVFETRDLTADPSTNRLEGKFYDILGNLKQTTNEDGIDLVLNYMDQGHVAEVIDPSTDDTLFRYYYDAGGQRRIKARGDSSDGIMDNASFSFYEGNDLICQLDRGEEIQDDRAYQPKFLLLDHLGTTRAELKFVEDEDTGEIAPTIATGYDYMPYGELITEDHLIESVPGNPDPRTEQVLFTGKPRDKESGLDYFGERFKDDFRFNSPDQPFADVQIWNPQSWNLYQYCGNNPIYFIDPDGRAGAAAQAAPLIVLWDWSLWSLNPYVIGGVAVITIGYAAYEGYKLGGAGCMDKNAIYVQQTMKHLNEKQAAQTSDTDAYEVDDEDKVADDQLLAPPNKRGNAPIGKDGNPVELHHPDQEDSNTVVEKTKTDHRGKGNYKKNHNNTGQEKSKIDRETHKQKKKKYFKKEWDSGRFKEKKKEK